MKKQMTLFYALFLVLTLILSGCGDRGPAGAPGAQGEPGTPGTNGSQGPVGQTGTTGGTVSDPFQVANFHGAANTVEATRGPNNAVNPWTCIDSAKVINDGSANDGKLQVNFRVLSSLGADGVCGGTDDVAYSGSVPLSALSFYVAQFIPEDVNLNPSYWVSYINTTQEVGNTFTGTTPWPDTGPYDMVTGAKCNQATSERTGTYTNNGGGSYTYLTAANLKSGINIQAPVNWTATDPTKFTPDTLKYDNFSYNSSNVHRVAIQMGDPDGTGAATMGANNAVYNFVPGPSGNGAKVDDPREVVVVENCNTACHKTLGLHGGGRLDTKLCVICHNPTQGDPHSGRLLDFKVMVHKIHSAKYLPSVNIDHIGHVNGAYNLDPEAAIQGHPYRIWGFNNTKFDFSEVALPANPANCLMCHKNATHGDQYKTRPTKEACGACHDGIIRSDGTMPVDGQRMWFPDSKVTPWPASAAVAAAYQTGHPGGPKANSECSDCHLSDNSSQPGPDDPHAPIPATHGDFTNGWSKVKTDYNITVSTDKTSYVVGDKPIVTVTIYNRNADGTNGSVVDPTTITDTATSDFGDGACSELYYIPLATSGVCNGLHGVAINGTLNLYVSGPRALRKPALTTAALNKKFFQSNGTIYGNASNDLRARTGGNLPLMDNYSTAPGKLTGVKNRLTMSADLNIQYQLAAIPATITPGTYVAMVHAAKKSSTGVVPNAMSIGIARFNVGRTTEEARVAFGCPDCHSTTMWHDNAINGVRGNHPAKFDPDYCGNCHDYEAQRVAFTTGGTTYKISLDTKGNDVFTPVVLPAGSGQLWKTGSANNMGFSAAPIARRVHGVHFARKANRTIGVNYPFEIYNGHNVSITFPQDIKNCEKCHPAAVPSSTDPDKKLGTSGSWKTKANRVACLACHDADATYGHGVLNTYDPTPTIATAAADTTTPTAGPYTGDEIESCPVCHTPKQ